MRVLIARGCICSIKQFSVHIRKTVVLSIPPVKQPVLKPAKACARSAHGIVLCNWRVAHVQMELCSEMGGASHKETALVTLEA